MKVKRKEAGKWQKEALSSSRLLEGGRPAQGCPSLKKEESQASEDRKLCLHLSSEKNLSDFYRI